MLVYLVVLVLVAIVLVRRGELAIRPWRVAAARAGDDGDDAAGVTRVLSSQMPTRRSRRCCAGTRPARWTALERLGRSFEALRSQLGAIHASSEDAEPSLTRQTPRRHCQHYRSPRVKWATAGSPPLGGGSSRARCPAVPRLSRQRMGRPAVRPGGSLPNEPGGLPEWLMVDNPSKRENFRRAFFGFDIDKIARHTDVDVRRLLADDGIVRNRAKMRRRSPTRAQLPIWGRPIHPELVVRATASALARRLSEIPRSARNRSICRVSWKRRTKRN